MRYYKRGNFVVDWELMVYTNVEGHGLFKWKDDLLWFKMLSGPRGELEQAWRVDDITMKEIYLEYVNEQAEMILLEE